MKNKRFPLLSFLAAALLLGNLLYANEDLNQTREREWIFLPYMFSSDSTGFAAGVSAIKEGLFQPQTTFAATVFTGLTQDLTINGEPD